MRELARHPAALSALQGGTAYKVTVAMLSKAKHRQFLTQHLAVIKMRSATTMTQREGCPQQMRAVIGQKTVHSINTYRESTLMGAQYRALNEVNPSLTYSELKIWGRR